MSSIEDVIIIGSGPAGYTAGLYAGRAMLNPKLFAGFASGGQLMLTSDIENFPGYPEGIGGPEMMMELRAQASRFGCDIIDKNVDSIDTSSYPFKVDVGKEQFLTKSVIITTGAEAIWLDALNEDKHKGQGISTCATCDGAFFRDKEVIVVGGGDSAMEEATFLTRFCNKVTIVNRRQELRASQIMADRARENEKIGWKLNKVVKEWVGEQGKFEGVILTDTISNEDELFKTDKIMTKNEDQFNWDNLITNDDFSMLCKTSFVFHYKGVSTFKVFDNYNKISNDIPEWKRQRELKGG